MSAYWVRRCLMHGLVLTFLIVVGAILSVLARHIEVINDLMFGAVFYWLYMAWGFRVGEWLTGERHD